MNFHDGIPFIAFGPKDSKWHVNPMHIIMIKDLDVKECTARNVKHPSAVFLFIGGPPEGYCITGVTADYIKDKINKTMTEWKHKLAEKELLS